MRFVTVRHGGQLRPGRLDGDASSGEVVILDAPDLKSVIAAGYDVGETGESIAAHAADLAPIIPNPDKIVCVGVNYMDHIEEMGSTKPTAPTYFAKFARALAGPNDDLVLPPPEQTISIDWECELAIVIGRPARHVSGADALACIAGFIVLNDVTSRDIQRRTTQFLSGKTFEGLTPVGPAMVSADEIGDGSGLRLSTTVNGVVKQESSTSNLAFNCVDIVSDLSSILTLDPGDIVSTGTPGGVGAARKPPEWLKPGDELITEVEGIGRLVNHCV